MRASPSKRKGTAERFRPEPFLGLADEFIPEEPNTTGAPDGDRLRQYSGATDLEDLKRSAFEEGRAAACAELPWHEADALRKVTAALEKALQSVHSLRRNYLRENRHVVVELALSIAHCILQRELTADVDRMAALVERALAQLPAGMPPELRLSPRDAETVEAGLAAELARLTAEHSVRIERDDKLAAGEARVLAGSSEVELRLPQILQRVREELSEVLDVEEVGSDE